MKYAALFLVFVSPLLAAQEVEHVNADTPREIQIRLARSAAPKEVSESADIYVLARRAMSGPSKAVTVFPA
jgi:hypothetical protein